MKDTRLKNTPGFMGVFICAPHMVPNTDRQMVELILIQNVIGCSNGMDIEEKTDSTKSSKKGKSFQASGYKELPKEMNGLGW